MDSHLDADTLADYAEGLLPAPARAAADAHLAACAGCRRERDAVLAYFRGMADLEPVRAPADFLPKLYARLPRPDSPWKRAWSAVLDSLRQVPMPVAAGLLLGVTAITVYMLQGGAGSAPTERDTRPVTVMSRPSRDEARRPEPRAGAEDDRSASAAHVPGAPGPGASAGSAPKADAPSEPVARVLSPRESAPSEGAAAFKPSAETVSSGKRAEAEAPTSPAASQPQVSAPRPGIASNAAGRDAGAGGGFPVPDAEPAPPAAAPEPPGGVERLISRREPSAMDRISPPSRAKGEARAEAKSKKRSGSAAPEGVRGAGTVSPEATAAFEMAEEAALPAVHPVEFTVRLRARGDTAALSSGLRAMGMEPVPEPVATPGERRYRLAFVPTMAAPLDTYLREKWTASRVEKGTPAGGQAMLRVILPVR